MSAPRDHERPAADHAEAEVGTNSARRPAPYADERRPRPRAGDGRDGSLPWDLFEDPEPEPRHGRRRWALIVLAIVPWVVIAGVLMRTADSRETPTREDEVAAERGTDGDAAPTSDGAGPTGPTGATDPWGEILSDDARHPSDGVDADAPFPEVDAIRVGGRSTAGTGEAAAVATLVARAWLGDVGAPIDDRFGTADTDAYVEHLTVEAVDFPAPGAAVVSIVAVLLDVEDGAYVSARPVRVAVPVHLARDGARPAGSPWWLPPPDLAIDTGDWRPIDDPSVLADAGSAIAAAGYLDIDVITLEHSGGWALRATVQAVAPDRAGLEEHVLWLREHLGDLVVAGWLPTAHDHGAPDGPAHPRPNAQQNEPTP